METPSATPTAGNSPAHHTTPCHANPPAPTTTYTASTSNPMTTMTPSGSHIESSINPVANSSGQENHLLIEPLAALSISKRSDSPTTDINNNSSNMTHKGSHETAVVSEKSDTDNNNNSEGSSMVGGAANGDETSPNSQQMSHPDSSAPESMVTTHQKIPPQTLPLLLKNNQTTQESSSQGEASTANSSNSVEQQSNCKSNGSVTVCTTNPRMSVSLEAAASSPIKTPRTLKSNNSNVLHLCSSSKCGATCNKSKCQQSTASGVPAAEVVDQYCGSGPGLPSNRSSSLSNLLPSPANMSAPPAGLSSLGGPLGGWSSNTSWCPQHSGGIVGSPVAAAAGCGSPMQGSQSWTGLGWPHSPVMRSSSTTSLNISRTQTCQHYKTAASPRSTSLPPPPRSSQAPQVQQSHPRDQPSSPTNSTCSTSSMRTSSVPPGPPQQQQAAATSSSVPVMSATVPHFPMEPGPSATAAPLMGAPQPHTTYGYMSPHSPYVMMPYYQYGTAGMVPPYYQWGPPQPVMMQWAPQPMGPPTPTPMCSTPTRTMPPHPAMHQPPTGVYQLLAAPHTPQRGEGVWRTGAPGTSPRTLSTKVLFSPGSSKMSSPRTGPGSIPPKPGYRVSLADYKPRQGPSHKTNLSPRKFPHPLLSGNMAHSYGSLPEAALRGLRPLADDRCAMMPITPPPTPHDDSLLSVNHFNVS